MDACMCHADESILLFKCFINHKVDNALSCIPKYVDIIKKAWWTPCINAAWAYHLNSTTEMDGGWAVVLVSPKLLSCHYEQKIAGQRDNNDGYLNRVVFSQNMALCMVCHSLSLFHDAILAIYKAIVKLVWENGH